ncbi:alanine racemase [Dermacoccaceae bacterium W4C1]
MPADATPAAVVDPQVLRRNLDRMAAFAQDRGVLLRPHAKTHKCLEIAALQREAGAVGLTVATLTEAQTFVEAGWRDVFIAYPLWAVGQRRRILAELAHRAEIRVGVDSIEAAEALVDLPVAVMLEVDSGHHRSGVSPEDLPALLAGCLDLGLTVLGAFTFPGHAYSPQHRLQAAVEEEAVLRAAGELLSAAGIDQPVLSGGSTPSVAATSGVVTEIRPGVYPFNDAQQWELGSCGPQDIAFTVHASVVSRRRDRFVLDAGSKSLGADRAPWASGFGRLLDHPQARIVALSEHHATVDPGDGPVPALGSVHRVVPNHVCNAVNLTPRLHLIAGDTVTHWKVHRDT